MPAISVSVLDGTKCSVNGRVLRVDETTTLLSVLELALPDDDRIDLAMFGRLLLKHRSGRTL